MTLVNIFHDCKHKGSTITYELRVDVFEILNCKWCDWVCELVIDDKQGKHGKNKLTVSETRGKSIGFKGE